MYAPPAHLRILKKSRRAPQRGDIFAFQIEAMPDRFFFGRVIATDTNLGGMDGSAILIYIYRASSAVKTAVPELRPSELLVPPIGTNRLPWSRGFFEVVKSAPVDPGDILPQHCFRDIFHPFVDEYGKPLSGPTEPVGFYGLSGIGSIDLKIGAALGLAKIEER
jgi:Immunity protein 26